MKLILIYFRTVLALGILNVVRVIIYRILLKLKLHKVINISSAIIAGKYIDKNIPSETLSPARTVWMGKANYFGWKNIDLHNESPNWKINPFTNMEVTGFDKPWWRIADFDIKAGDIKIIWEPSRFDWLLTFSQHICHGDKIAEKLFNLWLKEWIVYNPPYLGPNWKCGQEASIRVMHLATAMFIMDQLDDDNPATLSLLEAHLKRIFPTINYAIAQDNNHGTSEAAALFIGGAWLLHGGNKTGKKYYATGKAMLENRVERLVASDGSFSQYSMNYHRLMLSTLSICEVFRNKLQLQKFSNMFYSRARAATYWLFSFVDEATGRVPNIGANDGANILSLTDADYLDYRPAVHTAMTVFDNKSCFPADENCRIHLEWLKLNMSKIPAIKPKNIVYHDGGYVLLNQEKIKCVLRYPRYRFRPSHSDVLHIDLWIGGNNVLRDGGTYSYNSSKDDVIFFSGTAGHNTVQFDGRDQMPRLGRFLFGDWIYSKSKPVIKNELNGKKELSTCVEYRDSYGAFHKRYLVLSPGKLSVTDDVKDFDEKAVLRWRLLPDDYSLDNNTVSSKCITLSVSSSSTIVRSEILDQDESLYYLKREKVPVFEVEINRPGKFFTELKW
ncbi:MAG: heparinase II/III-family protein [Gammaproteobacteria bacterium]|nr:heparinase II/III-family protein [Gammaproteobacteria bacterium]